MTPRENLYFALGTLGYAIASADGKVHPEEEKKLHAIIKAESATSDDTINISDIIFHVLKRDHTDSETAYKWALDQIRLNSHYLSPEMKLTFLRVAEKVAEAFPPALSSEKKIIDRFRKDIAGIEGDPVFYKRAA